MMVLLAAATWTCRLAAQEVTVGEPRLIPPGPAPDEMPKAWRDLNPEYPAEMRKTAETGYVIVFRYVDASGKSRSLNADGTHLPFQRAVEKAFSDWTVPPARHGGVPIDAYFWVPVIFNPGLATAQGPDRGPQLLAVEPVLLPRDPERKNFPPSVLVHLQLDSAGAITQVTPVSPVPAGLDKSISAAFERWRFSPALRAGRPVPAEIEIPILLCTALAPAGAAKLVPPKLIRQVDAVYPQVMGRFQIHGEVTVDFVVDGEGRVRNPVIKASVNPGFDEAALEALLQWKFEPATVDGRKVDAKARQTIVFQPLGPATDIFGINERSNQSKLPPELRFDTPPRIRGVRIPVYPYEQRRDGTRGMARATMLIDFEGHVAAVKIQSASSPEFGLALAAALEGFAFDPALKEGRPVRHLLNFEQRFDGHELPDETSDRLLSLEKKHADQIVSAARLDANLKPLSTRSPVFPTSLDDNVAAGRAVVECLVDEKGRVRLPRIVEASQPAFGYAAVQAVATWWFDPPRKDGKGVVTRVRIPFDFNRGTAPHPQ